MQKFLKPSFANWPFEKDSFSEYVDEPTPHFMGHVLKFSELGNCSKQKERVWYVDLDGSYFEFPGNALRSQLVWCPFDYVPIAFRGGSVCKQICLKCKKPLPRMQETQVGSLCGEGSLEKKMAIHSSILAWRIPWTEELNGLQSMGLQRIGHNQSQSNWVHMHVPVVVIHSLSRVWLFVTPRTAARQTSLSFTVSWSLLKSCPLSQWCQPTISSVAHLSSCFQSFPASGTFPMSRLFTSGGQNIGASASASVLNLNFN